MQTANLENSRRLHEVSDWTTGFWFSSDYSEDEIELAATEGWHNTPKYDLSFLLDKLPNNTTLQVKGDYGNIPVSIKFFVWFDADNKWRAGYRYNLAPKGTVFDDLFIYADIPVDAACLLCIKLFETNILKKGVN